MTSTIKAYSLQSSPREEFASEVLHGLSKKQKTLPCRFFYDERGSALFEQITLLPEYYPTRTELHLLELYSDLLRQILPADAAVVEFGSGSSLKTELLLRGMKNPRAYLPIEISAAALFPAAKRIQSLFPNLAVHPVLGGFHDLRRLALPLTQGHRVGFFPGSTIGNMEKHEAVSFLQDARHLLGPKAFFILGADLKKPLDILLRAYNDSQGVTAAFNLNILARINKELGGSFDLNGFAHTVRYNEDHGRIEMHLAAKYDQKINILEKIFSFKSGETIHTENSHKYKLHDIQIMAEKAGWTLSESFMDEDKLFSIHILS